MRKEKKIELKGALKALGVIVLLGIVSVSCAMGYATISADDFHWSVGDVVFNSSGLFINSTNVVDINSGQAATFIVAASDSLHKERYVYVCDGVDDQVEIQAAIDELPSGGGRLMMLDGTFNISASIDLVSNITIEGSGEGTTIYLADSSDDYVIHGDSITKVSIKNLHINGNSANQTSPPSPYKSCVTLNNVTHFSISGVSVEYPPGHGIYICNGCSDGKIRQVTTSYAFDDGIAITGTATRMVISDCISHNNGLSEIAQTGSGIEIDDGGSLITITGCVCYENDFGISVHHHTGALVSHDISIVGNIIYANTQAGIRLKGWSGNIYERADRYTISSNVLSNNGGTQGGIVVSNAWNGVISGNSIFNQGYYAISVEGARYCTIVGNSIDHPSSRGIHVSNLLYSTIADNSVFDPGIYGYDIVDSNHLTITGNFAYRCGIDGFHFANDVTDLIVSNNFAYLNDVDGFDFDKGKRIIFSGNTAKDNNQDGGVGKGLTVGSDSEDFIVIGNDFSDYQAVPTQYQGAGLLNINRLVCQGNKAVNNTDSVQIAVGKEGYQRFLDIFMDVLAVSTTHVRSNEDLSAATPITFTIDAQPDVPRTLSGHFDSHANIAEYDIEIIGVDAKGNILTETKDETDGWDWETNNAFATITSIKMTSRTGTGVGDTMDIGITDVLGFSNIIYGTGDVFKIKKNNTNVAVAAAQIDTDYDTYDMSVIGLAATDDFTIWYKSNLNIIS